MGYSNVLSAGNRLRTLRNRYGFTNFDGKATTSKTSAAAGEGAALVSAPRRGRPARVKNTTNSILNGKNDGVAVEVTSKRKREANENDEDEDKPKQPSRRRNSGPSTVEAVAEPAINGDGLGKATSRTVHFARFPTPSKKRKKQAALHRRDLDTPSKRIFHIAAQTIAEARAARRRLLGRENLTSGLKLVFKVQA